MIQQAQLKVVYTNISLRAEWLKNSTISFLPESRATKSSSDIIWISLYRNSRPERIRNRLQYCPPRKANCCQPGNCGRCGTPRQLSLLHQAEIKQHLTKNAAKLNKTPLIADQIKENDFTIQSFRR